MSNAERIIREIGIFLDKMFLKNGPTHQELVEFIEKKWAEADDGKYEIHNGYIISGRMVREYGALKDYAIPPQHLLRRSKSLCA